ncbi:hypothetical protein AYI68_g8007 [Smittium mucronatum]|uniref:Uncharacterized protein n=1 Tax=Smittium mucronatum TaxID=133383 RepID=A0A1R0GM45_9FUNG|nr:hypothetical protein AYI68_g8007 [Smittium mucronatum]
MSIKGKVLAENTIILSKPWYSAHLTPLKKLFEEKIKKQINRFIWTDKKNKGEDLILGIGPKNWSAGADGYRSPIKKSNDEVEVKLN